MENQDLDFELENNRFHVRVAIWLTHNNLVLLQKNKNLSFWNLPGGRAKFGENTQVAIKRELFEELGYESFEEPELICVLENFFHWMDKNVQEHTFIYKLEINNCSLINEQDFLTKDKVDEINHWFNMDELYKIECKPSVIYSLPNFKNFNHVIIS